MNLYTGIQARRTGYFMLPDFASTAHMSQGGSLDAVLCNLPSPSEKVTTQEQIAGYVSLSRARRADKVLALQAFSPWLFRQGQPRGPELLVQKLRGDISAEDAETSWANIGDHTAAGVAVDAQGVRP